MSAGDARSEAGGHAAPTPALQGVETSQILNVVHAAPDAEVRCVKVLYSRCAPLGITELLVKRAKQEPPGVRLALLAIWRTIMASLGAKTQFFEPLWADADLDPQAVVAPEDRARAEAAAEEALAPCRVCVVDLSTFLKLVRRITLAARPNGDLILAVEVEYGGNAVIVATKLSKWIRETKEGVKYVIPLVFRENLRRLGLEVEADPYDLYVELTRRAEQYDTIADAYLKPVLLQAVEKLRASPFLARCSRDGNVIYIATELFRISSWYYDAYVGLGRNSLYEALRRHGLLASPATVPVDLYDEYGSRVKKRAFAFYIDRLSEFIEYDVESICRASAGLEAEEEAAPGGGHA
jgi:hypothetical protein